MPDPNLTIGTMSVQTRCSVPTIRYYEKIGLLPRPERASNGHRYYREIDLKRLTFIKRCRDFGFPIEQVRELTDLFEDGDRACVEVRDLAQFHLDEVRAKLAEMRELEASLAAFVCSCDTACSGGLTKDCVIIDDLATPAACVSAPDVSCCAVPAAASSALITKELKRK